MSKIIITSLDQTQSVVLPRTKIQETGKQEAITKQTLSGVIVDDMLGFRPGFTASWEYLPEATYEALISLLRTGTMFYVTFPDILGEMTCICKITYPSGAKVFKHIKGKPFWGYFTINVTAQEVIK